MVTTNRDPMFDYYDAYEILMYKDTYDYEKEDIQWAVDTMLELAETGLPEATEYVAWMYYDGEFVEKDVNKALALWDCAISNGLYSSCISLANHYLHTGNIEQGIHFLTLGAENDYAFAANMLGNLFEKGKYVPRDEQKALSYYEISAKLDNSEGKIGRNRLNILMQSRKNSS